MNATHNAPNNAPNNDPNNDSVNDVEAGSDGASTSDATRLEEKLAFLELRVFDLERALDRESGDAHRLMERLETVERALQILALRQRQNPSQQVQGADSEDDPVPHSG